MENVTYNAVWKTELCKYTISWEMMTTEGNITINEIYEYGSNPEYLGKIYIPSGMIFFDWDKTISNVTQNCTYTAIYESERQTGDINGDGKLNTRDIALLRQYVVGLIELDDSVLEYCNIYEDYYEDGTAKINTRDIALLQQIIVGIIN